jgi:hypothetical protein
MATAQEILALIKESELDETAAVEITHAVLGKHGLPHTIWMTADVVSLVENADTEQITQEQIDAVVERVLESYEWNNLGDVQESHNEALSMAVAEARESLGL